MIHGISPSQISRVLGSRPAARGGGIVAAESSRLRKAGESQSFFGCQISRKPIRQAMEISEAPMSTIQGLT